MIKIDPVFSGVGVALVTACAMLYQCAVTDRNIERTAPPKCEAVVQPNGVVVDRCEARPLKLT